VARLLAASGVPVDEPHPRDGYSPLHRAAWGTLPRHTETIATLVELGADPTRPGTNDGKTPLFMAQERSTNSDTVKLLRRLTNEFQRELKRRASAGGAESPAEPRLVASASNVCVIAAWSWMRLMDSAITRRHYHLRLYPNSCARRCKQAAPRTSCDHHIHWPDGCSWTRCAMPINSCVL
jgi:hypothetical protein